MQSGLAFSGDAGTDRNLYPKGPVQASRRHNRLLEKCNNLRVDLCANSDRLALECYPEHAEKFLTNFHEAPFRDQCVGGLHTVLASLDLNAETLEKSLIGNAEKLVAAPTSK